MRISQISCALGASALLCGCGTVRVTNMAGYALTRAPLPNTVTANTPATRGEWPRVTVENVGRLPVGVIGNALATSHDGVVWSVGGYSGRDSISEVYQLLPTQKTITHLPQPTHDCASGFLQSDLFVFGGGRSRSYDTVVKVHGGQSSTVLRLWAPLSDAVSMPFRYHHSQGLVLVGGYDDEVYNRDVRFVRLRLGKPWFEPLFRLPVGVRYPAVAVSGQTIYIAGGKTKNGISNHVYSWDATTNRVRDICSLPFPVEKAAAFANSDYLLIVGGLQKSGQPTAHMTVVNLRTGRTKDAGVLRYPLADMGYTTSTFGGFIAGGQTSAHASNYSQDVLRIRLGT